LVEEYSVNMEHVGSEGIRSNVRETFLNVTLPTKTNNKKSHVDTVTRNWL